MDPARRSARAKAREFLYRLKSALSGAIDNNPEMKRHI